MTTVVDSRNSAGNAFGKFQATIRAVGLGSASIARIVGLRLRLAVTRRFQKLAITQLSTWNSVSTARDFVLPASR